MQEERIRLPRKSKVLFRKIEEFLISKKILGTGSFSNVHKAKHKETGKIYAIKIMKLNEMSDEDLENIEKEVACHKTFRHENVVRLYDYFLQHGKIFMVMEFCAGGTLFELLKREVILDQPKIRSIFE